MSSAGMRAVLEKLAGRAEADEEFADALAFLAKTHLDAEDDPFASPAGEVLTVARRMNASRLDARRHALVEGCLTTSGIVDLVPTMTDRRAVDRRRHRGTLLGIKVGNTTYHPDWQFDRRAGETRNGLPQILAALRDVTADAMAAHQLMVTPQGRADGASIAEVFADGDIDNALTLIRLVGDQS